MAAPVKAEGVHVIAIEQPAKGYAVSRPWSSGLCDCCTDLCTCCAVWFCLPNVLPQMLERIKGPVGICAKVSVLLWCLFGVGYFLQLLGYELTLNYAAGGTSMRMMGSLLCMAYAIIMIVLLCTIRKGIRERDQIEPECCGDCEDCCCSFWCGSCALCQIVRHEIPKGQYELCSPTGSKSGTAGGLPEERAVQPA